MGSDGLHRRAILQRALLLAGMAMVPGEAMAALAQPAKGALLDKAGRKLLGAVADTIIPATDTPGALAVGVPKLFESLLAEWASPTHQSILLATLQRIDDEAKAAQSKGFVALSPEQRHTVLSAIDARSGMADPGYALLKNLVSMLYYMSETGSTVELRYEHVPRSWDPSLPVTPETRTQGGAGLF